MARDPNITVRERLIKAARRWAAMGEDVSDIDILDKAQEDECHARSADLLDAVRALEKHEGLRPLLFKVRPILRRGRTSRPRSPAGLRQTQRHGDAGGSDGR